MLRWFGVVSIALLLIGCNTTVQNDPFSTINPNNDRNLITTIH